MPMSASASFEQEIIRNVRFNFVAGLLDGGFFGFALGFGSFVTIIPLFVSQMTDSALLIGLIPAIHNVGWQLPQLLTAGWVSRLRRYKPAVLFLTIQERIPFLGLAVVAWFLPRMGNKIALVATFFFLIWQGLGGGFTANAWTSMISKIIPSDVRGTFFGSQAAAANALASISAFLAGVLLERLDTPYDYTVCFLLTGAGMAISWVFLALAREPVAPAPETHKGEKPATPRAWTIFRSDASFRRFLLVRMLGQFSLMGFSFYIIFNVQHFKIDVITTGIMTSLYMVTMIVVNPLLGRLGDRWSHRRVMELGALAAIVSSLIAWQAPSNVWFYPAFLLAAFAVVSVWTIGTVMTTEFGKTEERPIYIGLSNTLVAPATILAPIIGGFLADVVSYQATFLVTALGGLATVLVLHFLIPERHQDTIRNES